MKPRPNFKKSSLLPQKKREERLVEAASKGNLIVAICVLHDCFGFGEKRLNDFVDRYHELCKSMHYGTDDWKAMNQEIYERFGIKIV
jgi:hypothetical protein